MARRAATSARGSWPRACASAPPFRAPRGPARRGTRTRARRPSCTLRAGSSSIARRDSAMHLSVDPKVARALYYAWRAREQLRLPPATVTRMVACVRSVANSPFFRYPNIRLNQINFAAELHACAVSMTGDPTLLRRDYRLQLARFLRGAKRAVRPWRIPNLGPSYNFHRNPFQRAGDEAEHRVGRVRQHRARRHLLLRAGAARGDEADLGEPRRARCGLWCGGRCPPTGRTAAT